MIELFGGPTPNVLKVVIALEELGLAFNHNYIDIIYRKNDPDFLAVNPNGRVPAIVDDDGVAGEPLPLGESGAILYYLAEKHDAFFPKEPRARFTTMQWLMFQMSGIGPMFGQYVYFSRRVKNQQHALDRYVTEVLRLYDVVERRLGDSRFIGCDEYTIADMACFPPLRYVTVTGLDRSNYPNINRWLDEIAARPAVARAMEHIGAMDLDNDPRSAMLTDDQWDRLFARGKYSRAASLRLSDGASQGAPA